MWGHPSSKTKGCSHELDTGNRTFSFRNIEWTHAAPRAWMCTESLLMGSRTEALICKNHMLWTGASYFVNNAASKQQENNCAILTLHQVLVDQWHNNFLLPHIATCQQCTWFPTLLTYYQPYLYNMGAGCENYNRVSLKPAVTVKLSRAPHFYDFMCKIVEQEW